MKISVNGIDKSGKTTISKYIEDSPLVSHLGLKIAPKNSSFYRGSRAEYDAFCNTSPKEQVVRYERSLSRRRERYIRNDGNPNWLLERGDLTVFTNLITHLMEEGLPFDEAHKKLIEVLRKEIVISDDVSIYLRLSTNANEAIDIANRRGLKEEERPKQVRFLERSIPVFEIMISKTDSIIYVVDASQSLGDVFLDIDHILEDLYDRNKRI